MIDMTKVQREVPTGDWEESSASLDGWGITTDEEEAAFDVIFTTHFGIRYEFALTIPQLEGMLKQAREAGYRADMRALVARLRHRADVLEAAL